jgi:hypothetical protein
MPARLTSVCVPVSSRAAVEFRRYASRTPILTIRAGHPAALVTLTLPEHVEAGHVEFARQLARLAARYAVEVERTWRGLPALAATRPGREEVLA